MGGVCGRQDCSGAWGVLMKASELCQDVALVVWPQSAARADRRKGTRRVARISPGCQGARG
jgi:hypothetical protein